MSPLLSEPGAAQRQLPYSVRFEWGLDGARAVVPGADLAVVVDVLSFTTCVSVAVERGAAVFPYPLRDAGASEFAAHHEASLAGPRGSEGLSLSPVSLRAARTLGRVVLPSPNGSTISHELAATARQVVAVSLRNAAATADWALATLPEDAVIAVIAAGEKWGHAGLRPALEDELGAGAFIAGLAAAGRHNFSPESAAAAAAFDAAEPHLAAVLRGCSSGRELVDAGYSEDVAIAAELDASSAVAVLKDGAYQVV
ncbi:2-phosphosulfolactate phosphatase [Paenarthrobacter nitroguajacolicus]|uniref:2-phosphosulfolactate phosphatase n=1 Tax=Paenarthrobacter nitroguajacolicus TaxID=211146 RepID=UPI00248AE05F|nr:2-phosphosulfolactate phosphatase [Paenarthrobacter nitroguajacolicus]MDI2034797.1 2-phosphosulfolactate phosphatase [Paenarthrobacter nitroguajacolicus]